MDEAELNEVERLRLIEELADVLHWGVDAVWSCLPDPSVWPGELDPLWSYAHVVLSHEQVPDPRRIEELRELVDRAYGNQRSGLSLRDQQRGIDPYDAGQRRPEPLTRHELDDLLGLGHDAWSAEYPMPEANQRRLGELAVRVWQQLPSPAVTSAEIGRAEFEQHRAALEELAVDRYLVGITVGDDGALWVLPGEGRPLDEATLDAVADGAADLLGHRPRVRYRSWEPDGPVGIVPADLPHAELDRRFHLGSHDGTTMTCRGCRAPFSVDLDTGVWFGRHWRLCPVTSAE